MLVFGTHQMSLQNPSGFFIYYEITKPEKQKFKSALEGCKRNLLIQRSYGYASIVNYVLAPQSSFLFFIFPDSVTSTAPSRKTSIASSTIRITVEGWRSLNPRRRHRNQPYRQNIFVLHSRYLQVSHRDGWCYLLRPAFFEKSRRFLSLGIRIARLILPWSKYFKSKPVGIITLIEFGQNCSTAVR